MPADGAFEQGGEIIQALLRMVDGLLSEVRPLRNDQNYNLPAPLLSAVARAGLFGITIPERYGGSGLTLGAAAACVRAIAEVDRSLATTLGLHLGLGTRGLVLFGAPTLADRYLPDLAEGRRIAAFAATEPEAGSDLGALRTRAERCGDGWCLDGQKIYVTNGGWAGLLTVAAVETTGSPPALFVLEPSSPGVLIGREERKLGLRASSTVPITLEGVLVDSAARLAAPVGALPILDQVLSAGRTLLGAGCCGAAATALRMAKAHADQRRQFGRPLIGLEVVGRELALFESLAAAADALLAATCVLAEEPQALARRSAALKVYSSEVAWAIADGAIQLHGGLGVMEDTGLPLLLRDLRVARIFEGANDVLLTRLGAAALTSPIEDAAPYAQLRGAVDELKSAHGARAFLRHGALHRLGRLWVIAEAGAALERAVQEASGRATAGHVQIFQAWARGQALRTQEEMVAMEVVEGVLGNKFGRGVSS